MTRRQALFITLLLSSLTIACEEDGPSAVAVSSELDAGEADAGSHSDVGLDVDADGSSPDASSDTAPEPPDSGGASNPPFDELYDQGVLRYLGSGWAPTATTEGRFGSVIHRFEEDDGPRCYTGDEFFVATRDGGRDDLMIFLQGGGVCGPNGCEATENWPLLIPPAGVLNANDDSNPAADFDVAYIPYCDGTFFTGDAEHDVDGDGVVDRAFRGLLNLSASLDLIVQRYPTPSRIFLVGNSAGGLGVHFALPLVRSLYPDVPIDMINDSGIGLLDPGSMNQLSSYWNSGAFFPANCDDCIGDVGHLTGYHAYQLREDPGTRLGYISSRQDDVIVDSLSQTTGDEFEAALLGASEALNEEFGQRFNSMIIAGDDHTFVARDFDRAVGDTTIRAWLQAFLANDDTWVSIAE